MEIHIGFTGTQKGLAPAQANQLKLRLHEFQKQCIGPLWFHHGDCIGADTDADAIAKELGYLIHVHPPTNVSKRAFCNADRRSIELPYMARNQVIVDSSRFMFACPKGFEEEHRSGTWATIRRARNRIIPLTIIWPDGRELNSK